MQQPDHPTPVLTGGWKAAAGALVLGAVALAVGGFVNSFAAVRDAVEPSFGELAWTIPVLIDVGVAVFSGIDLLFTRLGIRLWWLRFVPWALIAATIWLNIAHETSSVGTVAHAAPPVLWVVTVELAAHALRNGTGLETGGERVRPDVHRTHRAPAVRWLLAPWSTLVIRRWMVLQGEHSYQRAIDRWWARKQAKWELQDAYGAALWRFRAPRRARGLYRWGHLNPTASALVGPPPEVALELNAETRSSDRPTHAPTDAPVAAERSELRTPREPVRRPTDGASRATFDHFAAAASELRNEGRPVSRTLVARRLRAAGLSLGNDRADLYLSRLRKDRWRPVTWCRSV